MTDWEDYFERPVAGPAVLFITGLVLPPLAIIAGVLLAILPFVGRTFSILALVILSHLKAILQSVPLHPYLICFCFLVLYMQIFLATEEKRESIEWINPLVALIFGVKYGFATLNHFFPNFL